MPIVFHLRRAYDRGTPVGSSKIFLTARGVLTVAEARDDQFKRIVRTATFKRLDDGEPIPRLRNADILRWAGDVFVLTGVEEVSDDKLSRPRLYAQSWILQPEPLEELTRAERDIGRLVGHLRGIGVPVEMLPGGGMRIPGELRDDGEPV